DSHVINFEEVVQANETVTSMTQDTATGVITYTDEEGDPSTVNVVSTDDDNQITVGVDGGAYYAPTVNDLVSVNTGTQAITNDDNINTVLVTTTSNPVTVDIPAAATENAGRTIVIRKTNGGGDLVTLSQSITDGASSFTQFNTQATITIQSDGTNWYRVY